MRRTSSFELGVDELAMRVSRAVRRYDTLFEIKNLFSGQSINLVWTPTLTMSDPLSAREA